MDVDTRLDLGQEVMATLRAREAELRAAGIRGLSSFGSVVRCDFGAERDVDLAAELDPAARMDIFRLLGLEQKMGEWLGRPVQLVLEPVENQRLQRNIDRDRRRAF